MSQVVSVPHLTLSKPRRLKDVLLVRHGQTEANRIGIVQGHSQTSLNELGLRQAALLADRLNKFRPRIDALLCSDLHRALQTANPIAQALDLPIKTDSRWRERCYGVFEGLNVEQRNAKRAELNLDPSADPPGAQSVLEYQELIRTAFIDTMEQFADATCLAIVTHGGACRAILALLADGRLPRTCNSAIPIEYASNCSVTHLGVCPEGKGFSLQCVNDVAHLASIGATNLDHG